VSSSSGSRTSTRSSRSAAARLGRITAVGLDGDDTLWHNEGRFQDAQRRLHELIAPYAPPDFADRLLATERRNLDLFGYGVKGFTLSSIETAIELSGGRVDTADIMRLIDLGKAMLRAPVELLDGAEHAVRALAAGPLRLLLVTKGDLIDQESRISRSGLADAFEAIEVVSEKDEATYARILARHGIAPSEFAMVGNSVRSDVLPVLGLGGAAVLVPYPLLWQHETASAPTGHDRFAVLDSLSELPALLRV
jgi:putative hydrolase of the HAD superfamily